MSEGSKSDNVNSFFFDGHYKEIWRHIFPEKTTTAETDFIIEAGSLNTGDKVLDLMCGHGRHTFELAKRGIGVLAIDNLPDYIKEISEKAQKENLPVECVCQDVMELNPDQEYDAIICMGNSFQFFNEADLTELFSRISSHLKPGGKFFINTWSLAEIVMKNFKEKTWAKIDGLLLLTESKYLFHPSRIETNSIIITEKGEREEKTGVDYIYTISEMEAMLNKTGYRLKEIYSIPGKKIFALGDPRAYIVAEKI